MSFNNNNNNNNIASSNNNNNNKYDYLIVVDFEATCDEGENPKVTRANQEVIEFPWVVVDTIHGQVVDSQQIYVKPSWNPQLTTFCTQLTGITDEMLSNAIELRDAINQFDSYVYTSFVTANKTFCLITDGPWDLKYCLRSEAAAKGIKLAPYYSRFFDLRVEFSNMHKNSHANNLKAMLKYLGLSMEGRHHSGISDCMNISKIVARLIKDGHRFTSPEVIPDNFVPEDNFKDYNFTNRSGIVNNNYNNQQFTGPETCVRLRGLPWSATEADVVKFFAPIRPVSVHLTVNFHGRATGEGYVEFSNETDSTAAMDYHRKSIGTRYVEVFKCSRGEMARAVNPTPHVAAATGQAIVRLRGIPYSAAPSDISAFFAGYDIVPNGITIVAGRDGRPSGEAFVQFSSEARAEEAIKSKHREKIGNRYIELFRSSRAELSHATSPTSEYQQFDPNHNFSEPVCVRLLGLPYSANAGDVINFFEGLNIVPGGVHFLYNNNQRPSGQGFVEFESADDAESAMERNKMSMGSRYIELFKCTKAEMMMELQGSAGLTLGGGLGVGGGLGGVSTMGNMGMGGMNMGMAAALNALMGNLSAMGGMGGMGGMNMGMGGMNNPMGGYGVPQPQLADIYALLQSMGMMNQYNAWSQQQQQQQGPPHHVGGGYPHHNNHYNNQHGREYGREYGSDHRGMGNNYGGGGATVRMRGLPFQATPEDIIGFFSGYDVIRQSVTLGGGPDGRPSGEAWVQFSSPEEASRAVREKNRAHMGSRYVELFLL